MRISDWSSDVCSSDLHGRGSSYRHLVDAGADHDRRGPLAVAESKLEWSNTAANASDAEKGGDQRGHQGFHIPFDERRGARRVAGRGSGTVNPAPAGPRSEEQTSALQSLMRNSYADFCFT